MKSSRRFFKIAGIAVAAVVAIVAFTVEPARGAKPQSTLNHKANTNKARHLVESAKSILQDNILASEFIIDYANVLAPADTVVMLETNNLSLLEKPEENPKYYPQLQLVESLQDMSPEYYYVLTEATPPQDENTDSMFFYHTAVKAYKRFPTMDMFAANLIGSGVNYLLEKRYVRDYNNNITDTLDLTPSQIEYAEELLKWADTIEMQGGYSILVDRGRAALYTILDRQDALDNLAVQLESRSDSTDVETLDLMTTLAYNAGDSLRVCELGLRRYELEPTGEHVYSIYGIMPNDTMRSKLVDAVFATAADTDIDMFERLQLLQAVAQAYLDSLEDDAPADSPLLDRISDVAGEIAAEDPHDIIGYLRTIGLVRDDRWVSKYAARHWMAAYDNVPDTSGMLLYFAEGLVPKVQKNPDFEKYLIKLQESYKDNRPDFYLDSKCVLGQYYFNNDYYDKALKIVNPITLAEVRETSEFSIKYNKEHGDEEETPDEAEKAKIDLGRWVAIRTLVSECQMKLKQIDNALATLNEIIVVDPENAGALNNLAYYMCENGKDLNVAQSLADRSLAIEEDNVNTLDTRAWISYRQGNYSEALTYMTKLFMAVYMDLFADILTAEDIEAAISSRLRIEALTPVLAHLAAIIAECDESYMPAAWSLVDIVEKYDAENEDIAAFLKKYKRENDE